MDIAHKEYLETESKENIINRILEFEDENIELKRIIDNLQVKINEKEFLIDKLLKVIKYQNGLNDKE